MEAKDYYTTLQIAEQATLQEVKSAYRRLALAFHPDKNSDPNSKQKFQAISEAYSVLSDPEKRAMYDEYGTVDMDELDMHNFEDLLDPGFAAEMGFTSFMEFLGPLLGIFKEEKSESGESMDSDELREFQEFLSVNSIKEGNDYRCGICSRKFKSRDATTSHIGNKHNEVFYGSEEEEIVE